MPVEDLSSRGRVVVRDGKIFRDRGSQRLEELSPTNGRLRRGEDGFLYFAGDPFPPGGAGTYRVGVVDPTDEVRFYPGILMDLGLQRFRITYRYLNSYRA